MSAPLPTLLLSAWLGASVLFATVVAPAAFAVLPSRALAGALVGRVLPIIFAAGIVVAILGLWLDRAGGGRAPRMRRVTLVIVAIACGTAQFVVAPRIERVRAEIGGAIDALPPDDARRAAFGRLHAISVGWLGLAMLAAGASIVLAVVPGGSRRSDTPVAAAAGRMNASHASR